MSSVGVALGCLHSREEAASASQRARRWRGRGAADGRGRFERLAGALAQKDGPPTKNADRHRIHKVSGDYLVARHVAGSGMARLVFIDDVGRDGQRARQAAAQAERLAEQQRQFEEETAGL